MIKIWSKIKKVFKRESWSKIWSKLKKAFQMIYWSFKQLRLTLLSFGHDFKNEKWFRTKALFVRSRILNCFYFCIALLLIFLTYYYGKNSENLNTFLLSHSETKISILMTVDGLITTSTFAFVAFIKISPNASGSSTVMNRVSWKGIWILRYHILLSISVCLTVSNCFFITNNWEYYIFMGTILSSIILLIVILKYVLFNRNLNRNSANGIIYILSTPYSYKKSKKDFRNLIHPLRGSSNVDFIKEIYTKQPILDIAIDDFLNQGWESSILLEPLKKIKSWGRSKNKKRAKLIYNKLNGTIKSNGISVDIKMELAVWVYIKMTQKNNDIPQTFEPFVYNYFKKLFGDDVVLKLENKEINENTKKPLLENYSKYQTIFENKKLLDEDFEESFK